jgi:hypothetical protein
MSAAIAAIVAKLEATSAVTDLCGTRIYSVSAPDGVTAPFVIFQHIATTPNETHDGSTDDGADFDLIQFSCFAGTPKAARALRDAVVSSLRGSTLSTGDKPTLQDRRDGDAADLGSDGKLYRADADFLI